MDDRAVCSCEERCGKLSRALMTGNDPAVVEDMLPLNRLVIYAGNVDETAQFYVRHFGFKAIQLPGDRIASWWRETVEQI